VEVDAHPAPLAPEWLGVDDATHRAGAATTVRVRLRNAGRATWRSRGGGGLLVAYHWLDPLGNPIVWDGERTAFPHDVTPGTQVELTASVRAPRPPGRYVLRFDLVEEHRFWLAEVGCPTLDLETDVKPRIGARRLAVVVHGGHDDATAAALAAQDEALVDDDPSAVAHLVAGAVPDAGWSARMLDAHEQGWPAVGPAVVPAGSKLTRSRWARRLAPWAPAGRNPRFDGPLLLPSLIVGTEPAEALGLPAYDGPDGLFEGRVVVTLRRRSGRPPT
jgi:hypothetical protein